MKDVYEVLKQKEIELKECRADLAALCRVAKLIMEEKDALPPKQVVNFP